MKLRDIFLALAVAAMFGAGVVFSKAAIGHFPPILLTAIRFTLVGLLMVWFVPIPRHRLVRIFFAALTSATISYSLVFSGLKHIDVSLMIIVVQLEIPFAALLAWLVFKDPLGWRGTLGMVIAFIGIGIIAGAPEQRTALLPVMLVMAGSLVWAWGQILIKSIGPIGGFTMIAWIAVFTGPQLFILSWIFEDNQLEAVRNAPMIVWIAVAYLVIVMTAMGYASWYSLLGRYDVSQVIPFMLLVPIVTILGGVVVLGEELTPARVVGGILVIAGVAAMTIRKRRRLAVSRAPSSGDTG